MFRCAVRAAYDAALFIPGDPGPSGRTHGHRYTVEAVLETDSLNASGFVADFDQVRERLEILARELDHYLLNEREPFRGVVPSAERQAEFFYTRLNEQIVSDFGPGVRLVKIRVVQEPEAWVEYEL